MLPEYTMIGSKTVVDFPLEGILHVPAKIDTGADSSSVWASDIVEGKGILSFKLFAPESPHYTGKTVTVDEYETKTIKNSFGHVENRYKVKLTAKIAGRKIKASFTLSNRENNTYPILVGRRTLHGKFLVDVSHATEKVKKQLAQLPTQKDIAGQAGMRDTGKNTGTKREREK